ncbi:MAG: hypothetical protein WCJ35_03085 [Planctomycetota bacterium]
MLRMSLAALVLSAGMMFVGSSAAVAASNPSAAPTASNGPGWLGVVVAHGELKQQIDSTPIVERPNRPFHFYGNAVRRKYYRGASSPKKSNMAKGGESPVVQPK